MLRLTVEQSRKVEENMGLVGQVLKDCVHQTDGGIYHWDDLFQIGCEGLCKAVQTDRPGKGAFSTYAYILIRNEIYTALEYATRRGRELATAPEALPCADVGLEDESEQSVLCAELLALLDRAERSTTGVTAKGIQAIRLLAQGYSNREIGEQFGVPANHITAWVAKARKYLATCTAMAS